ncbi:YjcZ family sporulation protein [Geobacillus sp. TFV-3]|nr:YjcZ family sporulation protein [Geobacillus sp. TFV-3]
MKEVPAVGGFVNSGYTLVIVLFILLIIVGCACVA